MKQVPENRQEVARTRGLAVAAAAIFLLAGSIFGVVFVRQQQATQSSRATLQERRAETFERRNKAAQSTPAQVAQKVEHAKMLRAKWRPWALQHKALLQKMRNAKPDDTATLSAVWQALPRPKDMRDISAQDLVPSKTAPSQFAWATTEDLARDSVQQISDSQEQAMLRASLNRSVQMRQDDFAQRQDMMIADSMGGGGNTTVVLWASGAITQQKPQTQEERMAAIGKARAAGRPARYSELRGTLQEVEPPYDFLQ